MDLRVFVENARLANRDPGVQSARLVKFLKAESPETILDLYAQAMRYASTLFQDWVHRDEPKALFDEHDVPEEEEPQDPDPTAPPLLGRYPASEPLNYDEWLLGWCFHQVLIGNNPPPTGYHFKDQPYRPAFFDFFQGMIGNANMHNDFQVAYERSSETLWPLAPREKDRQFLIYGEQREHAPAKVQLYRATAREVTMDINASEEWRQWWLSGPLRAVEFSIAESHSWFPGEAAMHTGDTPTSIRMRKTGLTVTGAITPNLDRILESDEPNIRQLVTADLAGMLLKVHQKYSFDREMPEAK